MSAVTVLVGAQILGFSYETAGMLLGLATSGALLVASRPVSQPLLVAAGSIGLVLFVPQSLSLWFPGSINAPAAVFVAGVVLLGGALATIRASRATHPAQPTRAAE
jgi:hypothetical protein